MGILSLLDIYMLKRGLKAVLDCRLTQNQLYKQVAKKGKVSKVSKSQKTIVLICSTSLAPTSSIQI